MRGINTCFGGSNAFKNMCCLVEGVQPEIKNMETRFFCDETQGQTNGRKIARQGFSQTTQLVAELIQITIQITMKFSL